MYTQTYIHTHYILSRRERGLVDLDVKATHIILVVFVLGYTKAACICAFSCICVCLCVVLREE